MRHFNISNYFHHVFIKSIILILALFTVSACTKKFPENNWINLLFLLDTVLNPPTEPTTPAVVSATLSTTTVIVSEEQTVPSASFTVVLDTAVQSGQTVTIPVTGIAAEGLVSSPLDAAWVTGPINLTFDDTNWNVPQTVFVKGVDTDLTQDASSFTQFTVTLGTVTTTDSNYTDFDPPDVLAFNLDNDTPGNAGVTIVPSSGLFTSEPAETATFGIVLNKQPAAASTVSITLASGDLTEGDITTPASKTLTFSTANWNVPQEVTVTGADDAFVDIDTPYSITQDSSTSSDPAYAALVPGSGNLPNINLFNKDNDFAGVSLDTTAVTTSETLTTQNITISLDAAPAAGTQVQIDISLIDPSEGTLTTPASIIFTDLLPGPQIVTIQGADDPNADGNIVYPLNLTINGAGTTDPAYGAVTIPSVSVTNTDDETAGITVTPVTAGILPEDGTSTATFDISLNTEPLFPVTVNVYSSDTSEAAINLAAALTFDAVCPGVTCWSLPRTITITGADDSLADGTIAWTIVTDAASSSDPAYNGMNPADVTGSTSDDDAVGITVWDPGAAGFTVQESGGLDFVSVVLSTQPNGTVEIPVTLSPSAVGHEQISLDNGATWGTSGNLIFTPANWYVSKTILLAPVIDTTMDKAFGGADPVFSITAGPVAVTSTDTTGYVGLAVPGSVFPGVNIEDEKFIFLSTPVLPNFDTNPALDQTLNAGLPFVSKNNDFNGIAEADNFCFTTPLNPGTGTYKSFITAPGVRIASNTPNTGDNQIDWVLKPNTTYYNPAGQLMTATGANSLFIFPFTNRLTPAAGNHYTGMLIDWTTPVNSNATCGLYWENASALNSFNSGWSESLNSAFVRGNIYLCDGSSSPSTENLVCVEQ